LKKLICILGLVVLFAQMVVKGQDPQFTQFYSVPLYLSPSFTGATEQQRFSGSYRQQWLAFPGDFVTYVFAYDHYFAKYNSGLGMMVMRDQAGAGKLGVTNYSLLYSYDFMISNKSWHLRPGLSFIYSQYGLNDYGNLRFPDQMSASQHISTEPPPSDYGRGNVDGTVSALGYNDKMWYGITVDHLLMPNQSFYEDAVLTPIKYTFFGGAKLISKGKLLRPVDESVTVAFQYRMQGDYRQLDLGLYWYYSPLVLGLWYRGIPKTNALAGDAVSFLAGVKMYRFSFGYSYDFTISYLVNSTHGAHEFSMIYEFFTKKRKRYHAIPCPEF
jgi:type IX secretion system PorP/SprF family membrane protein